jgi:hypothetical protein
MSLPDNFISVILKKGEKKNDHIIVKNATVKENQKNITFQRLAFSSFFIALNRQYLLEGIDFKYKCVL